MNTRSSTLKATHLRKAMSGFHPASIPLGYIAGGLVAKPDPKTAPHIKGAIERAAAGHTLAEIGSWLGEQGFRTKQGKIPSPETVSKLVTNPFYAGYVQLNGRLYPGRHTAIVGVAAIVEAARSLERRRRGNNANTALPSERFCLLVGRKQMVSQ